MRTHNPPRTKTTPPPVTRSAPDDPHIEPGDPTVAVASRPAERYLGHFDFRELGNGGWWHQPLDNDWLVAYEIPIENDKPVVRQIRIVPNEPDVTLGNPSGTSCPRSPLNSAVQRRVRTKPALTRPDASPDPELRAMLESPFVREILTPCGFPSSPEPVAVRTAAVRKRHAEILAAYAAIADKYPHGIHQLIGRVLGYAPRYVRDVVNDARHADPPLLTPTTRIPGDHVPAYLRHGLNRTERRRGDAGGGTAPNDKSGAGRS